MQFSGEKKETSLNLKGFFFFPTGLGLCTAWDSQCLSDNMVFYFLKMSHDIFAYFSVVLTGI